MVFGLLVVTTSLNPAHVVGIPHHVSLVPSLALVIPLSAWLPKMRIRGAGLWRARLTSLGTARWRRPSSESYMLACPLPSPLSLPPLTSGSFASPPHRCLMQFTRAFGAWSAPWPCMPCIAATPPSSSSRPNLLLLLMPLRGPAIRPLVGSAISWLMLQPPALSPRHGTTYRPTIPFSIVCLLLPMTPLFLPSSDWQHVCQPPCWYFQLTFNWLALQACLAPSITRPLPPLSPPLSDTTDP